jgi:N-acetylglutamate synthase-like GNAT family acetyltransferase
MIECNIRRGNKSDIPAIHALIKELAEYERAAHQVETTIESMERDGFGPNPLFEFFVAEINSEIVGLALYYWRYSTWKGRCLYLEDIVVRENLRGNGLGEKLFKALAKRAKESECSLITWQVLDWNEPAMRFYKRLHADFDGEWVNCKLYSKDYDKLL